jgi:hypothetical protein
MQIGFLKDEFFVKPLNSKVDFYSYFKGRSAGTLDFVESGGSIKYDLIGTGFANLYLISDRIISVLSTRRITGWGTFPVRIFDSKRNEIKGYFGFAIKGSCGNLDDSKSTILKKEDKIARSQYEIRKGLYFDITAWDNSDIFSPEGKMFIFVTETVKKCLENFTNIAFQDIREIEMLNY